FIESKFGYLFYLLPLLVFTLYYGLVAGIISFFIIVLMAFFFYKEFPTVYILWLFLFVLVASEFNYYWSENVKKAEEKFKYTSEKLRDLARELMLLKISHDQLEKQYIIKPISIREVIYQIKQKIISNFEEKEIFNMLMSLLVQSFNIEKAALVYVDLEKNNFKIISSTHDDFDFDIKDVLVSKAIEDRSISYLSKIEEESKYYAVIPVFISETQVYLFVIEEIGFLSLNIDTLLTIDLFIYYVISEKLILEKIKDIIKQFYMFDIDFIKEIYRMSEIKKNLGIESSLVIFQIKESIEDENIKNLLRNNLRGLDIMDSLFIQEDNLLIIPILLPFTPISGANSFVERVKNILVENLS
ncbi:MAG: PelD GGDEF domain-containing protein, partial [Sulfurihydrogenibium sp.]|nr:PelD GGDEF domain-containing protein [Sulfurihydrogenibium sp.]